jgi:hypothetical protein
MCGSPGGEGLECLEGAAVEYLGTENRLKRWSAQMIQPLGFSFRTQACLG